MSGNGEWNESLCGCFNDCSTCLFGYFCLPCLFGQNAEKTDNSSCVGMCCIYTILGPFYLCWVPHYMQRKNLRNKYGLREEPCGDCPTALCCGPCAICQEARFLKHQAPPGFVIAAVAPGAMPQTNQPRRNY